MAALCSDAPPKPPNPTQVRASCDACASGSTAATPGSPTIWRNLFRGRQIDAAILEELETRLLSADVGVEATERILEDLRQRVARQELADVAALIGALRAAIVAILAPCAQPLVIDRRAAPFVILVVGVNGSGKTTTIGKLARRCADEGQSVMLAAGDTFRAAAIEQLQVWAERSGAAFAAQQTGADPGAVVFDALAVGARARQRVLLADTAGRLHSQSHLMEELKKVRRVHPAGRCRRAARGAAGARCQPGAERARRRRGSSTQAVGVTGLVLTKLDGTAKGGIVIAIAQQLKMPIRFIGVGESGRGLRRVRRRRRSPPRWSRARTSRRRGGMIVFDRVSKRYANGREALSNVSFNIHTRRDGVPHRPLRAPARARCSSSSRCSSVPRAAPCWSTARTPTTLKARHMPAFRRAHRRGVPGPQAARRPPGVRQRRAAAGGGRARR